MPQAEPNGKFRGCIATTSIGNIVLQAKTNREVIYQQDLKVLIEQLKEKHSYWKINQNNLKCTLCDCVVPFTSIQIFKIEVRFHMKSVRHKTRYELFLLHNADDQKSHTSTEDCKLLKEIEKVENILSELKLSDENNTTLEDSKQSVHSKQYLEGLRLILNPLLKIDSTLVGSEKCIYKAKDGKNYFCIICQELIFESPNIIKSRYNLFTHLSDMSHKKRMSYFPEEEKLFKEVMLELSEILSSNLKEDITYFEIGPVSMFVKCSLCQDAVSQNVRCLKKHLAGKLHDYNKGRDLKSLPQRSRNKHLSNWFTGLMTKLEIEFECDVHEGDLRFIHCGVMPGYVVCSVCARVVTPKIKSLRCHFELSEHVKNKRAFLLKAAAEKTGNILQKPQENEIDPSSLVETKYGFQCRLCNLLIPPTSYAIYRHVIKSRCPTK